MFVVEGGGESLKSEQKTNSGAGWGVVKSLCTFALRKKNTWFFKQQIEFLLIKQQIEFLLISCLAVAKSFAVLSQVQHMKVFFIKRAQTFFFSI